MKLEKFLSTYQEKNTKFRLILKIKQIRDHKMNVVLNLKTTGKNKSLKKFFKITNPFYEQKILIIFMSINKLIKRF